MSERYYYGVNSFLAAVKKNMVLNAWVTPNLMKTLIKEEMKKKFPIQVVSKVELEKLGQTKHHEELVYEVKKMEEVDEEALMKKFINDPHARLWVHFDGITNAHNLGAALRSIGFLKKAYVSFSSEVIKWPVPAALVRISQGAVFTVPLVKIQFPHAFYRRFQVVSLPVLNAKVGAKLSLAGVKEQLKQNKKLVLVVGAENGKQELPEEVRTYTFGIEGIATAPMDSINLSAFVTLCVYELG